MEFRKLVLTDVLTWAQVSVFLVHSLVGACCTDLTNTGDCISWLVFSYLEAVQECGLGIAEEGSGERER